MSQKIYRKIWEDHYGPIPVDRYGRSYEIHHRSGIRSDNRIQNLQCVTIRQHFLIHKRQGDHRAAAAISRRMMVPPERQLKLNSKAGKEAWKQRTGWFDPKRLEKSRKKATKASAIANTGRQWYTNGKENIRRSEHPGKGWKLGRSVSGTGFPKGTILGTFWNKNGKNKRSIDCPGRGWKRGKYLTPDQRARRVEIGRQHGVSTGNRSKGGLNLRGFKHDVVKCPHCKLLGGRNAMKRYHFENCGRKK